jgi:ribosomal protein L11 methyltransferase
VDLDPQALLATRTNAERNGVSSAIEVQGIPAHLTPASCVVANILAGPLIELAPLLTQACEAGGDLLLSGLLKTQAHAVKAAYASGFEEMRVIGRDDWCCIHARRAA